jgi:uncharacterized RDD family membrane protein YckC
MRSGSVLDPLTHIETPENVRLAFRLAGPGSRMSAYLLDLVIRWAVLSALGMFLSIAFPLMEISGLPFGIYLVGLFLVEWGYGCLFEGLWNGQTPGKKAFHLRVVKAGGYPIGFHEAILRNLLRVADALPLLYGVGFITTLTNPRMQRIGDLVAGTIVIREKRQKLREELPGLRSVEPIPQGSFLNAYRPSERTLDVVDSLFRRRSAIGPGRVEEIAGILAAPLAAHLALPEDRVEARRRPGRFLFRLLATYQTSPDEGLETEGATTPPRGSPLREAS